MDKRPILVAEDSADDQMLILRSLRKHSVSNPVVVANNGTEALDHLFGTGPHTGAGELQPAIVLLDVKMPGLGGLDVLERIRANPSTRLTPVIMMTSSDEDLDKLRSYGMGANSYIRKPVDMDAFTRAVATVIDYWMRLNESPPQTER